MTKNTNLHFNSIKVQLKLCSEYEVGPYTSHFNSIKVQLKLDTIPQPEFDALFQFHKGTIKTSGLVSAGVGALSFQFHKGTIKTKPIQTFAPLFEISIP